VAMYYGPAAAAIAAAITAFFAWRKYSSSSSPSPSKSAQSASDSAIASSPSLIALDSTRKIPFQLQEKKILTHDTRLFRFALQSSEHILGLPIGQHMFLSAEIDGKPVSRAYTPTSSDDEVGYFDLVIKVYPQGNMTRHLDTLNIGDTINVQGPRGRLTYQGHGRFVIKSGDEIKVKQVSAVGMMAGGTGITPMLQVIRAVLKNPADNTQLSLIFANQTEADILLREDLEECRKDKRFKLWYTVDRPAEGWTYSTGFISEEMITTHLPNKHESPLMLMCGPPPMVKFACVANLQKLGFTEDEYFAF